MIDMGRVTEPACERRNASYDEDVAEARALASAPYARSRPTRLTDAKGRTYYASWVAACGGSTDLVGVVLDRWEQEGSGLDGITTAELRQAYRRLQAVMRDERECTVCSARFTPPANVTTALHCSNACRQRAYRRRRAEAQ
jgi:hypothetical protein